VGAILTVTVKPQWVRYKLDETVKQPCSDFLAHTSEMKCVRVLVDHLSVVSSCLGGLKGLCDAATG
jgi:hypothetical protein